jgi:hypothetical protein
MRQDCRTVFTFDELSDSAKDRACDWYRQGMEVDEWSDAVIEDAVRMATILGIRISTRSVPLMNGKTRQEPAIYFDLGRGAGVSFNGTYSYAVASPRKIREEAPQDSELHAIADTLRKVQQTAFYSIYSAIHDTRHCSIRVDSERNDSVWITDAQSAIVAQAIQDFAGWVLTQLEREYEYQTSNETIAENIRANEYEFLENGSRA